ncbi:MAG: hypothetical protein ACI4JX_06930 [Oscillospiraceae bacterium]
MIDIDKINNMNIDGSDFTPVFKLLGFGMNSFVLFISIGLYALIILAASLILLIPFALIGLNKKRQAEPKEYTIIKCVFIAVLALSILTGGILTRFILILPLILFNAVWAVSVLLFCIVPLRNKIRSSGANPDLQEAEF